MVVDAVGASAKQIAIARVKEVVEVKELAHQCQDDANRFVVSRLFIQRV